MKFVRQVVAIVICVGAGVCLEGAQAALACGFLPLSGLALLLSGRAKDPQPHLRGAEQPAAQAGQAQAAGSVTGKVVQEANGFGIRKVVVELVAQSPEVRQTYTTATDATGQFRFEGVAPGEYSVSVAKVGFVRMNVKPETARITVAAGQDVTGLVYKMQPAGVIAGKITDVEGDPLQGVSVWVTHVGKSGAPVASDASEQSESGQETTNDLGEYRIANLRAGQYVVQAQAHGMEPAPDPADKGKQRDKAVYALTFYPGTVEEKTASAVRVTSGGTATANFNMVTSRAFRVSGTVTMTGNPRNTQIFLVSTSGQTKAQGLGDGGRFEFPNILPGTYVAQIVDMSSGGDGRAPETHTQMIGSPIVVSNADVTGLVLQPEAGGSVGGKVRTEEGESLDWADLNVTLMRVAEGDEELPQMENLGALGGSTQLKEDGSFEMKDVAGGTYQVFLGGHSDKIRDYYMKSVTLDGREVADTGFVVRGETVVDVVLSAKGASVEGTVVDSDGHTVPGATVATLPSNGKLGRSDWYQVEKADASGHFLLRGMNPGAYVVVALEGLQEDTRKAEFFAKYGDKGVTVDLDEGERKSVVVGLVEER